QAARAPRVAVADAVTPHLRRVQMQPNVRGDLERAVARRVRVAVTEGRGPNLRLRDQLEDVLSLRPLGRARGLAHSVTPLRAPAGRLTTAACSCRRETSRPCRR